MDLKQLRTFRAVAELGSLSKASDRLRAAQPALSRHIKLLEFAMEGRRRVKEQLKKMGSFEYYTPFTSQPENPWG